ncbi:MAG: NifB/NifX family molybdenum-iron cluster-binding protein [Brevefilum sp.]
MKIALTVKGVGLGAWVEDYAQCGFVMTVDDDNRFDSWKNPAAEMADQPSQTITDYVLRETPDVLITGMISENLKEMLIARGVRVMDNLEGFVLELLEHARVH